MKKPRSQFANWFSFNQHRKRFGAAAVAKAIDGVDLKELKRAVVDAGQPMMTHGSKKELQAHLADLRQEFPR